MSSTAEELASQAEQLHETISFFKTGNEEETGQISKAVQSIPHNETKMPQVIEHGTIK
jgi:hypothetical protein